MKIAPADGSRDPRIDDPSNTYLIHPAGRLLLPVALRARISANAVSMAGFAFGAAAAGGYFHWRDWRCAVVGFALCIAWLVADGLDGMIARARGTASDLGRLLDGLCDHGVFALLYVSLAASIGTVGAWALGFAAALVHGVQSSLYEGERARFHRRILGNGGAAAPPGRRANLLLRAYEAVAGSLDRLAEPFDRRLRAEADALALGHAYGARAVAPMRMMIPLSNNMRVLAIFIACLAGDPRYFWWFELGPLSALAFAAMAWHRRVEARLAQPIR
jgi:CDP-diacylglycerol--serine O-phosphatidyltransferase